MQDIFNIVQSITLHELFILLLFMIPSNALMFYFALKFVDSKILWQKLIISGLLFGVLNLLFRKVFIYYEISMGTSILILASLFLITLAIYHKVPFLKAAVGTLVCYILIFMGSPIVLKSITVMKLTTEQVFASVILNTAFGYIEDIFLIIGTFVVTYGRINLSRLLK